VPAAPEQLLEEALVIVGLEPPRGDECQRAEYAEQYRREQDCEQAAPRSVRKEEFGKLAAGGIAAADHHGLHA
jgi:hypothetical protein